MKQIKFAKCPKCGHALERKVFATDKPTKYSRSCDNCMSLWIVAVPAAGSTEAIAYFPRPRTTPAAK